MRALRNTVIVLVVLGLLFVGADRLAVHLAEDKAAEKIRNAQGVAQADDVGVDIRGFPFLTQIAGKDLTDVEARLGGLTARAGGQELQVTRIEAHLRHVRLSDGYSSAVADDATGTARVSYAALTRAAGEGVKVGWGGRDGEGRGRVEVTGSFTVLGQTFHRSVHSTLSVTGGDTVRLHAEDLPGTGIPGIEQAVRRRIDISRTISGLPLGLRLTEVRPTPRGLLLSVHGSDVSLNGAG